MTEYISRVPGFTPEEYMSLKRQGYSDKDMIAALEQNTEELKLQQSMKEAEAMAALDPRLAAQQSMFENAQEENLIKWQLELDSILERIEHILRGDKVTYKNGSVIWEPVENKNQQLNDYGVSEILKILSSYLNRNTILSNYDEETINLKVYDLGMEMADLIYMKYEAMGMDTVEKRKLYPILVKQVIDMTHSAYLRALNGGERDSLREARQITQTESMHPGGINLNMPSGRERGFLNPLKYIGSKYK